MPNRPILLDTTRLLTRLKHPTPSGIDRVDLAYARHFLTGAADRDAVGVSYFGMRILPDAQRERLLATIGTRWRETLSAEEDPVLGNILARLAGGAQPGAPLRPIRRKAVPFGLDPTEEAMKAGAARWPRAVEAHRNSIYLHTSHLRLDRPHLFHWLYDRPDMRPVFFVHDLIPIDFPEYGVPGEKDRHRVRMDTISRHAAAVIANSAYVAERFAHHLAQTGGRRPPVTVAPLGVERPFIGATPSKAATRPYFVVCSTIEGRKNHLLLLQLWREMAGRLGPETPALVVVGRRGWESEAATDLLDRCEAIRGHVFEASELSTAGLAELVAGARALLMPSFTEGYGIPVVEALSAGTPVIASDIPVHREIAGEHATLVHPLDGMGWAREIARHAEGPAQRLPPGHYHPPSWDDHFRIVEGVLAAL